MAAVPFSAWEQTELHEEARLGRARLDRDRRGKLIAALGVWLLAAFCLSSLWATPRGISPLGTLAGVVTNRRGIPQMGAAIALISGDGRILQHSYTNEKGAFLLERLKPGLYSLRVTLTSFLPFLKQKIQIQPGVRSFLSVNLASLLETVDILRGRSSRPDSDEDWAWVLRSSGVFRPVLRYLPEQNGDRLPTLRDLAENRTLLQFSGGMGRSSIAGSEADFNTSFAVANNPFQNTSVLLSGNLGFERHTPAAAFRGVLRRELPSGSTPEVSLTLRQIFLPAAFSGLGNGENLQSMTLAASDRFQFTDSLRVEYGFLYDSVRFLDRLNTFSPHGRVIYQSSESSSFQIYYTEATPRAHRPGADPLRQVASQLAVFPRLSVRNGSPTVQRSRHIEASFQRKLGARTAAEVGAYRDEISDLTLNAVINGEPFWTDLFPDVFTQQYSFNSGNYHTSGVRASVRQTFSERLQSTFAYSYVGVLAPERTFLHTQDPEELRSILRMQRRHALAIKLKADVPATRTRVLAGYKWVLGPSVTPGDFYDESLGYAEPHLNILVRQPLPSLVVLPGRVEALADFRNLLAQGYVPIITADGERLLLVQNYRSFRGGFSFIF